MRRSRTTLRVRSSRSWILRGNEPWVVASTLITAKAVDSAEGGWLSRDCTAVPTPSPSRPGGAPLIADTAAVALALGRADGLWA